MDILSRFGVRARLAAVLTVSAILGILVLIPVMRTASNSLLSRPVGDRLLSIARVAAATAPTDAADWGEWSRRLPAMLPDTRAAVILLEPGSTDFIQACRALATDPGRAAQAFRDGEMLTAVPDDDGVLPGPLQSVQWEALAVLQDATGKRGLLVLVDRTEARKRTASSWALVAMYGLLVLTLALLGGFLTGYFLLVRPLMSTAMLARRSVRPDHPAYISDLATIRAAVEDRTRAQRELVRTNERQAFQIQQIRSDLKGAQAGLLRAEKLASVGQLAAGIAHEVGNPIGVILGMSEILKDEADPEQTRAFATQIHAATLRVHGTLKNLLSFARPVREEGAVADVADVIALTMNLLKPHQAFSNVAAEVRVDATPLAAEIRPSQLQQILVNLLLNAAYAMGGKGRVEIRARRADRFIEIRVTDDGPGILPEELERIFDPFYSTKPQGEGTGLGLSICAQLVDVYGGEITVENASGRGASFLLRLWAATDDDAAPTT